MLIRRAKKRVNLTNDARIKACLHRFDNGGYTRIQFLRAVSHSLGIHYFCNLSSLDGRVYVCVCIWLGLGLGLVLGLGFGLGLKLGFGSGLGFAMICSGHGHLCLTGCGNSAPSLGARVPCDVMEQSDSDDTDDVPTASSNVAPSAAVQPPDLCEVCLVEERDARHALVPCGHQRFCASCAALVEEEARGCPLCRNHGAASVLRSMLSRTIFAAHKAFDSFFPLKWTFW